MAKLSIGDVKHVAGLAKLELSKEEISKFQKQLSQVVDYINELGEVDTANTQPTSQTTGLTAVDREDEVNSNQGLTVEEAISGTDKIHNNYFVVKRLIEKNDV